MNNNRFRFIDSSSIFDELLFHPISNILVSFFYILRFSPNQITFLSTLCTSLSFFLYTFYYKKLTIWYLLLYFFGYLLDVVDGRYARKYNMTSSYGMMIDQVSDIITNFFFLTSLCLKFLINKNFLLLFITLFLTEQLSISFSLDEAYECLKKTELDDNFYEYKINKIKSDGDDKRFLLFNIFSFINYYQYEKYLNFIKNYKSTVYSSEIVEHKIIILEDSINYYKEFSTGNYCIFMILLILY